MQHTVQQGNAEGKEQMGAIEAVFGAAILNRAAFKSDSSRSGLDGRPHFKQTIHRDVEALPVLHQAHSRGSKPGHPVHSIDAGAGQHCSTHQLANQECGWRKSAR